MGNKGLQKIYRLSFSLLTFIILYSLVFMALMSFEGQSQNVNIVTAIYWVIVTMTTLGFGDIVFKQPSDTSLLSSSLSPEFPYSGQ